MRPDRQSFDLARDFINDDAQLVAVERQSEDEVIDLGDGVEVEDELAIRYPPAANCGPRSGRSRRRDHRAATEAQRNIPLAAQKLESRVRAVAIIGELQRQRAQAKRVVVRHVCRA